MQLSGLCEGVLEATHEGVCLLDAGSRIAFVNDRLCAMLGASAAELVGRASFEVFAPPRAAARNGGIDIALRRKDGSTMWAQVNAVPMIDEAGQPAGLLAMITNVTERKRLEQRARSAAEQIERLAGDAIYTVDVEERIRSWNDGAEKLFGWTKEEVLGRKSPLMPPDLRDAAMAQGYHVIDSGETLTTETVRLAKDGRRIPVLGSWSAVPLEDGSTGLLCILKDLRAYYKLQEQTKSLALLRERDRIAMDLHDGAIQSLYGVALSLGALRRHSGIDGHEDTVLVDAIARLRETIEDIRKYIYELRTGTVEDASLDVTLQAQADEFTARTGIKPRLTVDADPRRLSAKSAHHLLYIAHESLSNVARHSRAKNVSIDVRPWRSGLELRIADDGRGFDTARQPRRGEGLRNMRERASLLGARLKIESSPGNGATVKVQVP